MKNYILVLFCFLVCSSFLQAQIISIPIGKSKKNVLNFPADSGSFFVLTTEPPVVDSYTGSRTKGSIKIALYNSDLKQINDFKQSSYNENHFVSYTHNQSGYAFLFKSYGTITLLLINKAGSLQHTYTTSISRKAVVSNEIKLLSNQSDSCVYVLYPTNRTKRTIQKISLQGKIIWQKQIEVFKFGWTGETTCLLSNQVLAFDYVPKGSSLYKPKWRFLCISKETGSTISDTDFNIPLHTLSPKRTLHISTTTIVQDTLYEAGIYFDNKEKAHTHNGLFLRSVSMEGKILSENYYPLSLLTPALGKEKIIGKTEKLIPRHIIKTQTKTLLLTETLEKSPTGATAAAIGSGIALGMLGLNGFIYPQVSAFHIQDLFILDINQNGNIENTTKIQKYISRKTLPYSGLRTVWVLGLSDVESYIHQPQKHQYILLLKENPITQKDEPRIAYVVMGENGTSFELKSHLLSKLIQEDKKIKSIDWFLLSNGEVVLQYQTKEALHMKKITANEFN